MAGSKNEKPEKDTGLEVDAALEENVLDDDTTDDEPKVQPKKRRATKQAATKARPKVKPKPKAATPPVYRGDRVEIDGDEFIVRAVHGAGRVSLEGDEHPYTLWSPDEYEITRSKADREREAREARKADVDGE